MARGDKIAKDTESWISLLEKLRIHWEGSVPEVKYVKVHSSKKEKYKMSLLARSITEDHVTMNESLKEKVMLDRDEIT